ncbi:hypothetical protein LWI29_032541 [Acer saccharum]|uniref:Uncharacterized protein n=1 Tax=Acer saccharum TaxID=4024 RepID=A0AA39W4I1_ACESA|nr:hypothetical protein LWI29_032541 [Acer saccharum]
MEDMKEGQIRGPTLEVEVWNKPTRAPSFIEPRPVTSSIVLHSQTSNYEQVRRVYDFVNSLSRVQSDVLFTFHNEARTTDKANREFLVKMKDLAHSALTEKHYDFKELLKMFVLPVYHRHIEAAFGGTRSFEPEDWWYDPAIRRSWANMEAAKIIVEVVYFLS